MSILMLPEAFAVVSSACASGVVLGGAGLIGIQGIRRKYQAKKQSAVDAGDLPKEKKAAPRGKSSAEPTPQAQKSEVELAKEFNKEHKAVAERVYANQKVWLASVLDGESKQSRGDILRRFYSFGRCTIQRKRPLSYYGYSNHTWVTVNSEVFFAPILKWNSGSGSWEVGDYDGSLRGSSTDETISRALPHTEADWEMFARLVEVAEEAGVWMEKVDKFIQLAAANWLLIVADSSGLSPLVSFEDIAEAGRRQQEITKICFQLLVFDLERWEARAKEPKSDPVESAKVRVAQMQAEEAVKASQELEEAKKAWQEEAGGVQGSALELLADSDGALIKDPVVVKFQEAYDSLTEAEQRAGDRYLERIREAVDAEREAAGFAEATKNRVLSLATENRRIALKQLEGLLAASGTSREAVLVHSLRVSNKYLLEQASGI